MCGRFTRKYTWREIHALLQLSLPCVEGTTDDHAEIPPSYNIAPTHTVPVLRLSDAGRCQVVPMRWGLRPHWSKDGQEYINARAETAASNRVFSKAFASQRCLVPASGFYEWKKVGKKKAPYYFRMLNDAVFCLVGIWDRSGEGDLAVEAFAVLTTAPNELVAEVHDRMPVILRPEEYAAWLDPRVSHQPPLDAFPAEEMEAYPVSSRVNSPRVNESTLVQRHDSKSPADDGGTLFS